jgi:hypothetical protein
MSGMLNRTTFTWMLRLIFVSVLVAHAYYLVWAGRGPGDDPDPIELAIWLWAPVASGVSATCLFLVAVEKWLWRFAIFRGWLVLVPDLTGTWLAKSVAETFGDAPHYSVVTIDHQFNRLTYRAWREESIVTSHACILERLGQTLNLFVFYNNEAGWPRAEHSSGHDGSLRLQLLNERDQRRWELKGEYWTNKRRKMDGPPDRGTVGRISMKWLCRNLEGEHGDAARKHLEEGERVEAEHEQQSYSR